MGTTALIVPTCRPESYEIFRKAWRPHLAASTRLFVVHDAPDTNLDDAFDHADIKRCLGEDHWIISRRDSAIRSFGFWLAWKAGCDFFITLDDDCYPSTLLQRSVTSFLEEAHARAMVIEKFRSSLRDVRVRGMPYHSALGGKSVVNVGLWEGVCDLDAITSIANPVQAEPDDVSRCVPCGQYIPMCGMNLAFTRAAAPLMYFGLQGEGYPLGRFDDIWCGIIAKRICDHLGWYWTYGSPVIHHARASDPFKNLTKEAYGVAEHESYWRHLDSMPLTGTTAVECMYEAAEHVGRYTPNYLPKSYFETLSEAMNKWTNLFADR